MSDYNLSRNIKEKIFSRDNFSCVKCGFQDKHGEELEVHHIMLRVDGGEDYESNMITLCSICHYFAPDSSQDFDRYLSEKIDGDILETFRKSGRSVSKTTIRGMREVFEKGGFITRAPLGYKLVNKELLVDDETSKEVSSIFNEYLTTPTSLTQLAKRHGMTTSGIIKLLKNSTYLGIVKFADRESKGTHEPIISKELFDKIQEKLGGKK